VAEHLLPGWIGLLQAEVPDISLTLEVVNSSRVLSAVAGDRVDVGFVEGLERELPGMATATVTADVLVVVVGLRHPWASRRRPVSGEELAGTELVVREHGSGTREVLDEALRPWGGVRSRLELGSSAALVAAARRNEGPVVLSSLVARDYLAAGHLSAVPTEGLDLTRRLRAVWSEHTGLTPLAARLLGVAMAPKAGLGTPKARQGSGPTGPTVVSG
jgi:DNA-binding transcriptional LysR family regulator